MATIALPRPIPTHSTRSDVESPITPPHSLENVNRSGQSQNYPDLLPTKSGGAHTPPASPSFVHESLSQRSLLFPTDNYVSVQKDGLYIFEIDSSQVAAALEFASRQPLPSPDLMFPWLHGLHPRNQVQQAFFLGRQRVTEKPPVCARGVLLVKADGDLSRARLKGAVSPGEFMQADPYPNFVEADPQEGFSVRNFHIQTAKAALISDVIIYGEDLAESKKVAWDIAAAQSRQRQSQFTQCKSVVKYNTFYCISPYSDFEKHESDIVAVDSRGIATGKVLDFVQQERSEMCDMTRISEISHNVYMGPTPEQSSMAEEEFDILIECEPISRAWLHLHTSKRRNFFAYPTDVSLLTSIAPQLLRESPLCAGQSLAQITASLRNEPKWLPSLDGSFPSRVLDYLYLGNLGHANNPELLKELGIGQILSVGEMASWNDGELGGWGPDNVYVVQGIQDNGIDPLTNEFPGCLEFISRGRRRGTATLVHCRVGVSRSATICIAEVMRAMNKSFPRAYCFVRARRLNVIIQPHLRFAYELLQWEEWLQQRGDTSAPLKREMEWREVAKEIALINRPYLR
ncbi:hypothetical protein E4U55_001370 [Claviceps digitariae]|nr:hypothetical protein E4U55_001370 [Claviceps digitariae]